MDDFTVDVSNPPVVEYSPELEELENRLKSSGEPFIEVDQDTLKKLIRFSEQEADLFKRKEIGAVKDVQPLQEIKPSQENQSFEPSINTEPQADLKSRMRPVEGGTPINITQAAELRLLLAGTTVHPLCKEWKNAGLLFQNLDGPFPYGLHIQRNCARGLQTCVQACILKQLIFNKDSVEKKDVCVLQPSTIERRDALIGAICELIWQAGNKEKCCVALIQDQLCFKTTYDIKADGITEKIHLFDFTNYSDLQAFVRKYISYFEFESTHGCILLLYSVVLSRTVHRILDDAGMLSLEKGFNLLTDNEGCSTSLINLLLTGHATEYFHNGRIEYNQYGDVLPKPLIGVTNRSNIGLLFWNTEEPADDRTQVGSMLKTPKYPIWLTMANGYFGVLFSIHSELISDWRAEHLFHMYYYNGTRQQEKPTRLDIDTRYGRTQTAKTSLQKHEEDKKIPLLEWCIMSKWFGAEVEWNGSRPFV